MNKSSSSRQARERQARARARAQVNDTNNKRKRCLEMVMRSVTDDLWFEIFLRLPLKDLLVSKSVSKSWLSIISSHRFVKSHLDRAITSGEDAETLIVHHNLASERQGCYAPFSLSHLGSCDILELLDLPYSQGDYPFQRMRYSILGSQCGIVCVLVDFSDWPAPKRACDIYLWNPATKLSKLVPPSIADSLFLNPSIGFGFDHIDFDFKVVEVVSTTFSAEVYSSNRNAWRKIEPKLTDIPCAKILVCLHGFLLTPGRNGLMAFDLNKEVFVCNIKLPADPFHTRIFEFNDSIAVSTYQKSDKKVKLWTLDEEACLSGGGVEASWTIKLSFDLGGRFVFLAGLFNSIEFLLLDQKCECFFYNPNKEAPRDLRGPLRYCRVFKHTKSLFSVAGSKPVKWTGSPWKLQLESDSDICGNG